VNKQIKALSNKLRRRGQSADSRASGTTVGTTHTHDPIIHEWNKKIQQFSNELSVLQSETGNEAAIKKIKKQIAKINNKIKKRKEKHNTGAATPQTVKSAAQSFLSHLTAAAGAIPGSTKAAVSTSNVKETGLVQIIKSKTNDSVFPMLPPPILNDEINSCIQEYYGYHEYIPTQTHYSYESYASEHEGNEKPRAEIFYIHMQVDRKKKNRTIKVNNNYVAYVKEHSYFSEDLTTLRGKNITGYLYMSFSCLYKKDDKKHVGFITFLIPYSKEDSLATVSNDTVCSIKTSIPLPAQDEVVVTLPKFMEKFGSYVYASDITLDADGISMTENVIKSLVKRFTNIQNNAKTLKRTYKGFKMEDQVTIWANINCKTDGNSDWMAKIKMLLPFIRPTDINVAKDIIANAIGQCQHVVGQYHKDHPGDSQEFFKHIWGTTVWILIAEMSKEKMNNQRIADLSTGIQQKFGAVYLRDTEKHSIWREFLLNMHQAPTTPILDLKNIIHETTTVKSKNVTSSIKLPGVNAVPSGGTLVKVNDKPGTAATQFRDW
jgi:hypothetical protein